MNLSRATEILLGAMSVCLASITIVEKYAGTGVAQFLYHSPVVLLLWALLVACWAALWWKTGKFRGRTLGSSLLHLSFVVILAGASITFATETEGRMRLGPGEAKGMIVREDGTAAGLPFSIRLDSLQVSRYPGTDNPSGYTSFVTIERAGTQEACLVSVNHPLRIDGWRIYQSSWEPDTAASVFSVSHDPVGVTVTYVGYVLLLLAFVLLMFSPRSRFAVLRRQLGGLSCLLLLSATGLDASASSPSWDRIVVQDSRGRMEPMDSYCRELMRKIHHSESFEGMDAVECVMEMMAEPEHFYEVPFIYQKNSHIARKLGQDGRYVSISQLFGEDGSYLLDEEAARAMVVPAHSRSTLEKDVLKLTEKLNLVYSIIEGSMLPVFPLEGDGASGWYSPGDDLSCFPPRDSSFIRDVIGLYLNSPSQEAVDLIGDYQRKRSDVAVPSDARVAAELACNRVQPFRISSFAYLLCGLALLLLSISGGRKVRPVRLALLAVTVAFIVLHGLGIAARWFYSSQPPWSNSYEIIVYMAWCTALLSLLLSRKSEMTSALGVFFSGLLLLVAGMNRMDPAVTPLVPVLQSPWLMFHVAVIMGGYSCFGINFLLSLSTLGALALRSEPSVRKTAVLSEMFALAGLTLMTVGTFLGAVWANESWGAYWSWDPKETWALITILVYALCTHARLVPRLNSPKWLSILSIIGFACVLMTYFGVNFFLSGMHSYAG